MPPKNGKSGTIGAAAAAAAIGGTSFLVHNPGLITREVRPAERVFGTVAVDAAVAGGITQRNPGLRQSEERAIAPLSNAAIANAPKEVAATEGGSVSKGLTATRSAPRSEREEGFSVSGLNPGPGDFPDFEHIKKSWSPSKPHITKPHEGRSNEELVSDVEIATSLFIRAEPEITGKISSNTGHLTKKKIQNIVYVAVANQAKAESKPSPGIKLTILEGDLSIEKEVKIGSFTITGGKVNLFKVAATIATPIFACAKVVKTGMNDCIDKALQSVSDLVRQQLVSPPSASTAESKEKEKK